MVVLGFLNRPDRIFSIVHYLYITSVTFLLVKIFIKVSVCTNKYEVLNYMKATMKEMILKIRRIGGSLTVIIPKHVAELYGIDEGSGFEAEPISKDELVLRYRRTKEDVQV